MSVEIDLQNYCDCESCGVLMKRTKAVKTKIDKMVKTTENNDVYFCVLCYQNLQNFGVLKNRRLNPSQHAWIQ